MKITKDYLKRIIKEEIKKQKVVDPDIKAIKKVISMTWAFVGGDCDEGLTDLIQGEDVISAEEAIKSLDYKLAELSDIRKADLVCPYCKTKLTQSRFNGYYSEFDFWGCNCSKLPNIEHELGDRF